MTASAQAHLDSVESRLGFVPTSIRIMSRKPELVMALDNLGATVMKGAGISRDLKQMIAYIASLASGCRYCQAHTAQGNARVGIDTAKTQALWEFETSPLFSPAERAALRLALLAGQTPNAVEDEDFKAAREYFDDDQLVEIVAVIAFFGFANRWNDTLATPLEDLPLAFARDELATAGWEVGKHSTRART